MPSRPASFRHLAILQQAAEERALVNGLARECTQLRVPYMRAHAEQCLVCASHRCREVHRHSSDKKALKPEQAAGLHHVDSHRDLAHVCVAPGCVRCEPTARGDGNQGGSQGRQPGIERVHG